MECRKKIPPDGGWGWMVVLGTALSNLCVLPIMYSFGLIFREIFDDYGLSHKDASIILNINSALGMLTGMVNGALLKYWGCRKVALLAGLLLTSGIILTTYSDTFLEFVLYYGTLAAFGMGMSRSAFNLAINMYFVEKRGKAVSLAMTITGVGPILIPQLISYLMNNSSPQNAILIVGAISGHSIVAALLLQPVKWHMKTVVEVEEEEKPFWSSNEKAKMFAIPEGKETDVAVAKKISTVSEAGDFETLRRDTSFVDSYLSVDKDIDAGALYGFDTPLAKSLLSLDIGHDFAAAKINKSHSASVLYNRKPEHFSDRATKYVPQNDNPNNDQLQLKLEALPSKEPLYKRILKTLVNIFDLKLLCDPIYVNIMIGMSLAVFAEMNFSILTPFIFADFGLSVSQNATCLSTLAISDIVFRFLAPYIAGYLKQPPRIIYMLALTCLIGIRFGLLVCRTYVHLLCVSVAIGMTRGIRIIYRNLLIPTYVPIDRLASANGMQMVVNGVFMMIGGPILGIIRDQTGNYSMCIIIINAVTLTCIVMWCIEIGYLKLIRRRPIESA